MITQHQLWHSAPPRNRAAWEWAPLGSPIEVRRRGWHSAAALSFNHSSSTDTLFWLWRAPGGQEASGTLPRDGALQIRIDGCLLVVTPVALRAGAILLDLAERPGDGLLITIPDEAARHVHPLLH